MAGVSGGRRETIGEDLIEGRRRLRRKGKLVTAKTEKSGDTGEKSLVVFTATEINAVEDIGAR